MSDLQLASHGQGLAEGGIERRLRTATAMRLSLLAVAALLATAAVFGPSHLFATRFETVPTLEVAFGFLAALSTLFSILVVPLMMPVQSLADSAAPCALQSAGPARGVVPGRLYSRALISGVTCELAALLGVVLHVLGSEPPVCWAMLTVTILSSLLTFPRRDVWEAAMLAADSEVPGIS